MMPSTEEFERFLTDNGNRFKAIGDMLQQARGSQKLMDTFLVQFGEAIAKNDFPLASKLRDLSVIALGEWADGMIDAAHNRSQLTGI